MKFKNIFIIAILIILPILVFAAPGDPTQFGNSTTTTVWIGGDTGIGNFTGNVYATSFYGDGSQLTGVTVSDIWVNTSGDTMTGNLVLSNANITADYLVGILDWVNLSNYPASCPSGAITQLGDTVTCTDGWVDIDGDTMTGNLDMVDNNISNINSFNNVSGFINHTITDGNIRYFSNGCYEKVNSTGLYWIC